jgi:undecaprenyl-diphosphatase
VDWRIYHAVNAWTAGHEWVGDFFGRVETWGVLAFAVVTAGLWLLSRPGGERRWKLASASAFAAAGVALLVNQAVGRIWHRPRPYETHDVHQLWVSRTHDASFPSDHASAAFAIAFAVLRFDRLAGALFLAAAVVIAGGRVVAGAHYPSDVLAGALVGLAGAAVAARVALPVIRRLVGLLERVTDPFLRLLRRSS